MSTTQASKQRAVFSPPTIAILKYFVTGGVCKVVENQTELWYLGDQVCYPNNHITTDTLQPLGVEAE